VDVHYVRSKRWLQFHWCIYQWHSLASFSSDLCTDYWQIVTDWSLLVVTHHRHLRNFWIYGLCGPLDVVDMGPWTSWSLVSCTRSPMIAMPLAYILINIKRKSIQWIQVCLYSSQFISSSTFFSHFGYKNLIRPSGYDRKLIISIIGNYESIWFWSRFSNDLAFDLFLA
jgi:hypothetical protein